MRRFNALLDVLLFYLLSAALFLVVGICCGQVVARYLFGSAFTWAEEVSIIILLWAAWPAACLALKEDLHIRVRILDERLRPRSLAILRLALAGLAILFLSFVMISSRTVIQGMAFQTLMSLPSVPLNSYYVSIPVGCALMIYYLLRRVVSELRSWHSPEGKGA